MSRRCAIPDGDLVRAIRHGGPSVATDRIGTFTERGLGVASDRELEADVVVIDTGLNFLALGGMSLAVDREPVRLTEWVTFEGMMLDGLAKRSRSRRDGRADRGAEVDAAPRELDGRTAFAAYAEAVLGRYGVGHQRYEYAGIATLPAAVPTCGMRILPYGLPFEIRPFNTRRTTSATAA